MVKIDKEKYLEAVLKYSNFDLGDSKDLSGSTQFVDIGMSSIEYVSMIVELEILFNVTFDNPAIYSMELTIEELYNCISE